MKTIFLAGAALFLATSPAHAQLLGGSVGGVLGGAGSLNVPVGTVTTATRGTLDSAARTTGSQSVDRKQGRVKADRSAEANGSGALDQAVSSPLGSLTGSGSARAQGSDSASADTQLIGTDAVRSTVGQAAGTTRGLAGSAVVTGRSAAGTAIQHAQGAGSAAGSASGMVSGAASGVFSGAAGQLALAGSAAVAGEGAFGVAPGMPVIDSGGDSIGQVRQVFADSRGHVRQLLVTTDRGDALLPAANFDAAGSLLVSGMSEGKVEKVAERQSDDAKKQ